MSTPPPTKFNEALVPPAPDELEVSIFGPGRGECVVLHLGNNEWCVVDSCVGRGRSEPVAVEYLKNLRNNALDNVRLVIATHWHDDHINGLASILELAPQAKFCCSVALKHDEFLTLVSTAPETIAGRSGVDEFASVLKQLKARGHGAPMFAVENKSLLQERGSDRPFPISLTTLSPSDPTILSALMEIASLLPKEGEPQRRIIDRSANYASVVLSVEAGGIRALLGADLEHTGRAGEGWIAIMNCDQATNRAQIFKVPHHGSEGADHPDVWNQMLEDNPIAVVTPFTGGNVRLPKDSDLKRLSGRTSGLYCTAPGAGKPPSRDASVERNMRLQLAGRRVIEGLAGHVRIRWSVTNQAAGPDVKLFNGAYRVSQN